MATRADTTLQRIADTDYQAGLAVMRASAESQEEEPVVDRLDLAMFRAEDDRSAGAPTRAPIDFA